MLNKTKIVQETYKGLPIIYISGSMTYETDEIISNHYREFTASGHPECLIINFEKTDYINSAGLGTLINIIKDMNENNSKVYLSSLSSHFKKLMDIVGISDFVNISETNEEVFKELNS